MLVLQDINAGYRDNPVLQGVSLEVRKGQFVGIIGPNGCGKTTLLRVVAGVLRPSAGQVLLEGVEMRRIPRRKLARTMACLAQDMGLDLSFTVRDVVQMGRWPHLGTIGRESQHDREVVERAMESADVLHMADKVITETSGGERRRAFIAMCLAQEPRLFLLDEPTTHLDIGHQLSILDLIRSLNQRDGMTVVAVFHDLNLAAEYCDQLLILNQGREEAFGTPEQVLTPETIQRVYGAGVSVEQNPVSHRPHVVLSAGANRQ
jgi:iron complex transport system ATP-binding protein